ncbi:MAG: cobalamin-dependent protein [Armatimonadota bacterium]|nr:cobalamin-dependent protein [Armatimonadota bacterium]
MLTENHQQAARYLAAHQIELAETMVQRQYTLCPQLVERYGEEGRVKCLRDACHHLEYVSESLAVGQPLLFVDYVAWARIMLAGRDIPVEDLATNLECLCSAIEQILPQPLGEAAVQYVQAGLDKLQDMPATLPSFLLAKQPLAQLAQEYQAALLAGDRHCASRLVLDAVQSGVAVQDIYLQVFQPCQHDIGRLWQMNEISVAQEHYCTAAAQLIMSQLYPYLFGGERNGRTLVATCIAGDLHEIGIRMVSDLFELDGWDTFYLGANTPIPSILQEVRERNAGVLAISATITPHLKSVEELIRLVRSSADCSETKILVGGYPFNIAPELWQQIGADGCAGDAAAVETANQLVKNGAAA